MQFRFSSGFHPLLGGSFNQKNPSLTFPYFEGSLQAWIELKRFPLTPEELSVSSLEITGFFPSY